MAPKRGRQNDDIENVSVKSSRKEVKSCVVGDSCHRVTRSKVKIDWKKITSVKPVVHADGFGEEVSSRSSSTSDGSTDDDDFSEAEDVDVEEMDGNVGELDDESTGDKLRGVAGTSVVVPKLRGRVSLKSYVKLTKRLVGAHREFIEGTVLKPLLRYPPIEIDRYAIHALVNAWIPEKRAFRLRDSYVKFTKFDVALLTGLPLKGKKVKLNLGQTFSNMGEKVLKICGERGNSVQALLHLCNERLLTDDSLDFFRYFSFYTFSAVLFPTHPGKAAWMMEAYVNEAEKLGKYAWGEAVWEFLVGGLDGLKERLPSVKKETGIYGFSTLLQCWLYEHHATLSKEAPLLFPRICRWDKSGLPNGKAVQDLVQSFPAEQIVTILEPSSLELEEKIVRDFVDTAEWKLLVEQALEGLSPEEVSRRACEMHRETMDKLRYTEEKLRLTEEKLVETEEQLEEERFANEFLDEELTVLRMEIRKLRKGSTDLTIPNDTEEERGPVTFVDTYPNDNVCGVADGVEAAEENNLETEPVVAQFDPYVPQEAPGMKKLEEEGQWSAVDAPVSQENELNGKSVVVCVDDVQGSELPHVPPRVATVGSIGQRIKCRRRGSSTSDIEEIPMKRLSQVLRPGVDEQIFTSGEVQRYLEEPLTEADAKMVELARKQHRQMQNREIGLEVAKWRKVCGDYVTGLVNKVNRAGNGDRCVDSMAVRLYAIVLARRRFEFPNFCHNCVYLVDFFDMDNMTREGCTKQYHQEPVQGTVIDTRYVFTPIIRDFHWFLLVTDLKAEAHFLLNSMRGFGGATMSYCKEVVHKIEDVLLLINRPNKSKKKPSM